VQNKDMTREIFFHSKVKSLIAWICENSGVGRMFLNIRKCQRI